MNSLEVMSMLVTTRPTSPGVRHQKNIPQGLLSKTNKLVKSLYAGLKKNHGRNTFGHITVRHKGGGVQPLYHYINFTNSFFNAITISTMYDSFRNAFVSLNFELSNHFFFKTLATAFVGPGSVLMNNQRQATEFNLGSRYFLRDIPSGALLHSFVSKNSLFIKAVRAAGTSALVLQKEETGCTIKMPSGQVIAFPLDTTAVLGVVSNGKSNKVVLGKAGRNRLLGKRPSVRGVAMNPVDHPHGGRTNGGRPSCTPWGIPTKGKITVLKKLNIIYE